ncbi:hypothetical protein Salat_0210900 [Sesamum alatum]|uniref:Uncharacterized protein n=1 Tax=Sesamum alatum TaxID=300844 RepID=A0AAE1YZQ8_9LAMI|nr:hypothetical protein Salat_0210900 [Sesamum alatum]
MPRRKSKFKLKKVPKLKLKSITPLTFTYGSVRRAVDRNGLVVPHSHLQWGLLFFFLGEYANMILMRCGALHLTFVGLPFFGSLRPGIFCAINPSGRRLVVGGPAELSETIFYSLMIWPGRPIMIYLDGTFFSKNSRSR